MAVSLLFFVNGALFASWATRVPDVRDRVGAGEAALGLALLGVAVGSLLAMPAAGVACVRWGGRPVAVGAALAYCASAALPALAHDLGQLGAALFVLGAASGTLDVAMNVEAIAVERAYRRPIMPSFHGWFSVGGLAGALAGALVAGLALSAQLHLAGAGALAAASVVWAALRVPPADVPDRRGARARVHVTRPLLVCGLIAFCAAFGEGAMSDWSALYLTDTVGAGAGLAALGYAAFAGAMALGRFSGERVIGALGAGRTLQLGCGAEALALALGLAAEDPVITIAAFAIAGLGVACVFPIVLSAAGRAEPARSGPAVAVVSTIGYTGFLSGPPLIGAVAEQATLGWGLGVVALLSALAAVLGRRLSTGAGRSPDARTRPAISRRTRSQSTSGPQSCTALESSRRGFRAAEAPAGTSGRSRPAAP